MRGTGTVNAARRGFASLVGALRAGTTSTFAAPRRTRCFDATGADVWTHYVLDAPTVNSLLRANILGRREAPSCTLISAGKHTTLMRTVGNDVSHATRFAPRT